MRAYQPIDARAADDAPSPSKARACRAKPPRPSAGRCPVSDSQPVIETPQVLARIPNLAEPSSGDDQDTDLDLDGARGRGFGWPLRILVAGVVVVSAVVLKPMVWPLNSGNKDKASETGDQPPRWPAPSASNVAAPKWDAKSDQSAAWPRESGVAGPDQRVTPRSEESPGVYSDPWASASAAPPSRDPMPWRSQAQQAATDPLPRRPTDVALTQQPNAGRYPTTAGATGWNPALDNSPTSSWDATPGLNPPRPASIGSRWDANPSGPTSFIGDRSPGIGATSGSAAYGAERQGPSGDPSSLSRPTYRTAARPSYAGEPRATSRDDPRADGSSGPAVDGYPQFTNSQSSLPYPSAPGYQELAPTGSSSAVAPARQRSVPPAGGYRGFAPAPAGAEPGRPTSTPSAAQRWDYPSTGVPQRWSYPSTDQTGREAPAATASASSWGPNPGIGGGNPAADPGSARLEGYIEKLNVRTSP
jgi:hypothetical protein